MADFLTTTDAARHRFIWEISILIGNGHRSFSSLVRNDGDETDAESGRTGAIAAATDISLSMPGKRVHIFRTKSEWRSCLRCFLDRPAEGMGFVLDGKYHPVSPSRISTNTFVTTCVEVR